MEFLYCKDCGIEVPRKSPNQVYCPDCAAKYKSHSVREKKPPSIFKHTAKPEYGNGEGQWNLRGKSLTDIALEAKALGMSYGEYVNACSSGKMENILAARGLCTITARNMIRKAKIENEKRKKEKKNG